MHADDAGGSQPLSRIIWATAMWSSFDSGLIMLSQHRAIALTMKIVTTQNHS